MESIFIIYIITLFPLYNYLDFFIFINFHDIIYRNFIY